MKLIFIYPPPWLSIKYRIAGNFCMVEIFVYFIASYKFPCTTLSICSTSLCWAVHNKIKMGSSYENLHHRKLPAIRCIHSPSYRAEWAGGGCVPEGESLCGCVTRLGTGVPAGQQLYSVYCRWVSSPTPMDISTDPYTFLLSPAVNSSASTQTMPVTLLCHIVTQWHTQYISTVHFCLCLINNYRFRSTCAVDF